MLRSVKELQKYSIDATDGTIGRVKDCYFDDDAWVVRYLVIETGAWLVGRDVLISPLSIGESDDQRRLLPVSVTKDQVKNSPGIDSHKPVSRQHELAYSAYYGYPCYWGGTGLWGGSAYPSAMLTGLDEDAILTRARQRHTSDDQHLRSCEAVKGYHVHASDGDIGHVEEFLVDERTWAIRYLIVNTSNWWLGHQVVVAPAWIDEVSWVHSKLTTGLTRRQIQDAPAYDPQLPLNRGDEEGIYGHYRRRGYWLDRSELEAA